MSFSSCARAVSFISAPLGCSLCWTSGSALLLAAASACFFCMSAWTLSVEALPSADRFAICCRLTYATFAPAGNGARGRRRAWRGAEPAPGRGGCAGRAWPGAACAKTGAALNTSASNTQITTPFITSSSFRKIGNAGL